MKILIRMEIFDFLTLLNFHGASFNFVNSRQVHGTCLLLENDVNFTLTATTSLTLIFGQYSALVHTFQKHAI